MLPPQNQPCSVFCCSPDLILRARFSNGISIESASGVDWPDEGSSDFSVAGLSSVFSTFLFCCPSACFDIESNISKITIINYQLMRTVHYVHNYAQIQSQEPTGNHGKAHIYIYLTDQY